MNIIWIDGGLGNQMFQYALALKQESLGREVKIDATKYAEHHVHNDFELDRVFGIESVSYTHLSGTKTDRVKEIAKALQELDFETYIDKFDMSMFRQNDIYPDIWEYEEEACLLYTSRCV